MSWQKEKARIAALSPEEREAFKIKRAAQQRRSYLARQARQALKEKAPPKPKPKPEKPKRTPEEREAAEKRYAEKRAEYKRAESRRAREKRINDFLAQGAQENGFSAFLRSKEVRIADALTRPNGDIAA